MTYEESAKVYVCCGQYIAPTKATLKCKIVCPRCKRTLTDDDLCKNPKHILIVKK